MWFYIATMALGLTWVNGGSDGGDLITAVAIGGVPHPTGYPLYLIIAKFFQAIPIGSLAYRTNLLSAVCMVSASMVLYAWVTWFLNAQGRDASRFAGLVAGLTFGLSPLVWSQAVITEVYALHALLFAVLLFLWTQPGDAKPILYGWRGLCLGLALGNHLTSLLFAPLFIADIFLDKNITPRQKWTFVLYQSLWAFTGLTVYLILPFRAATLPPVNWGNPQTLDGFVWLVSGQLYWGQVLIPIQSFLYRIAAWATILLENFSLPGIYLGLLGVVYFYKKSRFFACTLWTVISFSVFAIQYGTVDSNLYLIPVIFCFAAWVGIGVDGVLNLIRQRTMVKISLGLMLIVFVFITALYTVPEVDASHDERAEQFAEMALTQAPANAILFVKSDRAVFGLWYYHFALKERSDLAIIASDLLHFPWYLETLQSAYPTLKILGPFPWTQTFIDTNPDRPYCYINGSGIEQIDCVYP